MTSFKSILEFDTVGNIVGLPEQWSLENLIFVFSNFRIKLSGKTFYLENMILNSVLYAVGCAFIQTAVQCIVAYLAAKFRFKFSGLVYWVVVITMTIPVVGTDISTIQILQNIGLYDSMIGMYVLKFNFLGAYFLVFYATFRSLPDDYAGRRVRRRRGRVRHPDPYHSAYGSEYVLHDLSAEHDRVLERLQDAALVHAQQPHAFVWHPVAFHFAFAGVFAHNGALAACIIMVIPIIVVFIVFKNRSWIKYH